MARGKSVTKMLLDSSLSAGLLWYAITYKKKIGKYSRQSKLIPYLNS